MTRLKFLTLSALSLVLAACEDQAVPDPAPDMDKINQAALGPAEDILLTPISFDDVERHDLFGMGCNLLDQNGAMLFIAQSDQASFLIAGQLVRAAADMGAKELPYGARTHYLSSTYALDLTLEDKAPDIVGDEVADSSGTLEIRDPQDRLVYRHSGVVQCGA